MRRSRGEGAERATRAAWHGSAHHVMQSVLALVPVGREQRPLRRSVLRDTLWVRSPRSPRSGANLSLLVPDVTRAGPARSGMATATSPPARTPAKAGRA